MVARGREHIKLEVNRLRSIGKTDEWIVDWIENKLDAEIGLYNYFDSVHELAEWVKIPVSKFHIVWM